MNKNAFFKHHRVGVLGLIVVLLYFFVGLYAPFFASSLPLAMKYEGKWYFPLFTMLFNTHFFTKPIDLFFNVLMFVFPAGVIGYLISKKTIGFFAFLQMALFLFFYFYPVSNPASDPEFARQKQMKILEGAKRSWAFDLQFMNDHARINVLANHIRLKRHDERIRSYLSPGSEPYTPWKIEQDILDKNPEYSAERNRWIEEELKKVSFIQFPFLREFHWEDDAGGDQSLNLQLPWWEITRIHRKDFAAALIFGIRISLVVGFLSIAIALMIGIPIGAIAGYKAGVTDIIISRVLEIWESMPTFFMLLLIVAILQSKSIFIVIFIIGLFGWTGFARYIRGEFFKQRSLPYVESCQILGFSHSYTIFKHILPNAIPPLLTLLPFAILGAITAEAGLSFLGLGEEGTSSWGVLMDEGRQAFPGESYLLWPPALMLTLLLVAIAVVGDALRDSLDPRLKM